MSIFKKATSKGYLYLASEDSNCIILFISLAKKDIYKPTFLYKLPKVNLSFINSLSRKDFISFCQTFYHNSYIDFKYKK